MPKPILVANWKNHPNSLTEAKTLIRGISSKKLLYKRLSLFVAPPFPYLDLVSSKVLGFAHLASQDVSLATKTTTGAVTVDILKSFGTKLVIVGHSERRAMGETSHDVSEKIKLALKSGLTPLVCVGELTRDDDGDYYEFLREEIGASLQGLGQKNLGSSGIAVAYEPVWAIGKDARFAIDASNLSETIIFIKKVLSNIFGRKMAEKIPILYGGAVEPSNAKSLYEATGIRGFLVGHASLDARSFGTIAEALTTK